MMYGPDVFAVLTPYPKICWSNTIRAFGHPHNVPWTNTELISSRETTPALSLTPESENNYELILRFEQLNHVNEILAGTDQEVCQILLHFPGVRAVSARQYTIIVQADNSITLEDRFSTFGTHVLFDGEKKPQQELDRKWVLAGQPTEIKHWNEVVICTGNIACVINFPNHISGSPEYLERLRLFRERKNIGFPLFGALNLHSKPTTAAPSQPFTPNGGRDYYVHLETIASSPSTLVEKIMNTSDEKLYVKKTMLDYPRVMKVNRKRKLNEERAHEDWLSAFRDRMRVLQVINHPNIIQVVFHRETPQPYYITRYYDLGNLQDLCRGGKISEEMVPKFLLQILLALREFHRLGYAHRDVKESNIFVDKNYNLVLGDPDFLKSEKNDVLKTFCGSYLYAAPEIYRDIGKPYGKEVDIWSAAICILRIFDCPKRPSTDFPDFPVPIELQAWHRKWRKDIRKQIHDLDENDDQVIDILKSMLECNSVKRYTVDQCLKRGCENGLFKENRFGDIVLDEATEANTPTTLSDSSFDDREETPKPRSPLSRSQAEISTEDRSCRHAPESLSGDAQERASILSIPSIPSFLASSLDGNTSILVGLHDIPIPTIEGSIENLRQRGKEQASTGLSPSISEGDIFEHPARRLKILSPCPSDWSQTIGLELSSFESGFSLGLEFSSCESGSTLDEERAEDKVLSKLRIRKDEFSSDIESSFH